MVNFSPIDKDNIVRRQSDLENTKDQRKSTALGGVGTFAVRCNVLNY